MTMSLFTFLLRRRHNHHRLRQHYATAATATSSLQTPLSHPTYFIWSSNTSLGKTLVSTGLAISSLLSPTPSVFHYLKPVQTGFPSDSDSFFVFDKLHSFSLLHKPYSPILSSHHVLYSSPSAASAAHPLSGSGSAGTNDFGMVELDSVERRRIEGERSELASELVCKTAFAWKEAVSPHLAAERESGGVRDGVVVKMMEQCLREAVEGEGGDREVLSVVETAGGVASPGPSGSLQCDLYRPFRLPAILVGDGRLGGISATISAYETLKLRGYDVVAVIFEDHGLVNEIPVITYLRNRLPVLLLPPVPQDLSDDLMGWFRDSRKVFDSLKDIMHSAYSERMQTLSNMPKKAKEIFWWPFTQHSLVPEEKVTVIDSRYGENFAVFEVALDKNKCVSQLFDACASWWTQGPDPSLQIELSREMGYAASRFGHVMFPENVYEPALECAELLLEGVGKGWASRTYFSDNGSTAIEIALKMAFRKFSIDAGILSESHDNDDAAAACKSQPELMVLALTGSYHGDTLGAMEAQSPSSYTGFLQQPWYTGRGLFLDPPKVYLSKGKWRLSVPSVLISKQSNFENMVFSSREAAFCKSRESSDLAEFYASYVSQNLSGSRGSSYIGALIIEPVIQAAGGMHMVDPLFQRILVSECRKRKIPIIFDEVFTGFWRLGAESAAELLGCAPDIACYAKLMTGGIIPLSATLATEAVFNAFLGKSKLKALLHGHSYTAHAMGCSAAAKAIKWFKDPQTNYNISAERKLLKELWDVELVNQISSHPAVRRVVALGTLFVLELQADDCNSGYGSLFAKALLQMLRDDGIYTRPLGHIIYLMCSPCTSAETCHLLLSKVLRNLEEFYHLNRKVETKHALGN